MRNDDNTRDVETRDDSVNGVDGVDRVNGVDGVDGVNGVNGAGGRGTDSRLSTEDLVHTGETTEPPAEQATVELFPAAQIEKFRIEWQDVQTQFVDDPRAAVRGADHLVAEVMRSLASTFADHKKELEGQWQSGSEVETEDLRLALRRYRSFFNQLLSA